MNSINSQGGDEESEKEEIEENRVREFRFTQNME